MIREAVIQHWEYVVAFKEGKQIQYKNGEYEWIDINSPNFTPSSIYRIKPESELIPFTFENANNLIGKVVIGKTIKDVVRLVGVVTAKGVILCNSELLIPFDAFSRCYTFLDGSPCGIIAQNE